MSDARLEVVILIGLQASGKSTFCRKHFGSTHLVISKDHFRNNRRPQRRQMHLLQAALEERRSVVIDNTNPRLEDRADLIGMGRRFGASVRGFYFSCTIDMAKVRNAARIGKERVSEVGILSTAKALCRPSLAEGFDELHFVRAGDSGDFIVERFIETTNEA
jgi:predicted kinase